MTADRAQMRRLRGYLTAVRAGLIEDLGPEEEDLTMAQLVLIDRIIAKLAVARAIEERVAKAGIFPGVDQLLVHPSLDQNYLAFCNSIRLALSALGISKRAAGKALDPLEIARIIDAKAAQAAQGGPSEVGQGSAQGDAEKRRQERQAAGYFSSDELEGEAGS